MRIVSRLYSALLNLAGAIEALTAALHELRCQVQGAPPAGLAERHLADPTPAAPATEPEAAEMAGNGRKKR